MSLFNNSNNFNGFGKNNFNQNKFNVNRDLTLDTGGVKENVRSLISFYNDDTPVEELKSLVEGRNEISINYLVEEATKSGKMTLAKNIREAARYR